jgi:hypothetical protein
MPQIYKKNLFKIKSVQNFLGRLLITFCMYCDGCDTEALNCKPITNLKEKIELPNLHQTSS